MPPPRQAGDVTVAGEDYRAATFLVPQSFGGGSSTVSVRELDTAVATLR